MTLKYTREIPQTVLCLCLRLIFKDCKIGSLKWFWDPTLQSWIEWRLWDVWDSFSMNLQTDCLLYRQDISHLTDSQRQLSFRRFIEGLLWLLLSCLLSAVVSSQWERERSHRQQPRSARPSLWPGLGGACAVRPGGQRRPAVQCGPAASREREREWPVSVPGGQSWCDHSVSHYTVHTLHPHPHQAQTGLHANTFMWAVNNCQKQRVKVKCRIASFFKQALLKSM